MAPRARAGIDALPLYRPGEPTGVRLASNESPFGPLPSVLDAIAAAGAAANRYPAHTAPALRERLAADAGLDPAHVTLGAGTVALLQHLCLAFAGPGDEVVFGWPSFEAYPIFAALAGATGVPVPLRRLTVDLDAVAERVGPRTRLVLLANPNNPTGTAFPAADVEALLARVPGTCLVVLDEAYREFAGPRADGLGLVGRHEGVAVLRTFSKAHGLAALRVGAMYADPSVVAAVDRVLIPFSVNAVAQAAALASLDAAAELAVRVGAVVAERDRVAAAVRRLGLGVPDARANFVWLPAGEATTVLADHLRRQGISTRAFPEHGGIRVTAGAAEDGDRFLDALARADGRLGLRSSWAAPTGERAATTQAWVERIGAVRSRLEALACLDHTGLSTPDAGGDERWDAGQIWAHLGEFGTYWLDQIELVAGGAASFGRTKTDPHRVASVEAGRHRTAAEHLARVTSDLDRLRGLLCGLSAEEWSSTSTHPTLGRMDLDGFLGHFLVGHYEEHADQLEALR